MTVVCEIIRPLHHLVPTCQTRFELPPSFSLSSLHCSFEDPASSAKARVLLFFSPCHQSGLSLFSCCCWPNSPLIIHKLAKPADKPKLDLPSHLSLGLTLRPLHNVLKPHQDGDLRHAARKCGCCHRSHRRQGKPTISISGSLDLHLMIYIRANISSTPQTAHSSSSRV